MRNIFTLPFLILIVASCQNDNANKDNSDKLNTDNEQKDTVVVSNEQKDTVAIETSINFAEEVDDSVVEIDPVYAESEIIKEQERKIAEHKKRLDEKRKAIENGTTDIKPTKTPKITEKIGQLTIAEPIHNFGGLIEGDTVNHTFTFKNTGSAPIIIYDVFTSCGCTVPSYSKNPIMPGESGKLDISFNTKGKLGTQEKKLTLLTNGKPAEYEVKIKSIIRTD